MSAAMRLLVCGGRRFRDVPRLWADLDGIHQRRIVEHDDGISCLINGRQQYVEKDGTISGADYWAYQWSLARGIPSERYFADWDNLGRSAGPIRNRLMRDEGKPTHGLAMPGGTGTSGMVALLKEIGVPVMVRK